MITPDGRLVIYGHLPAKTIMGAPEFIRMGVEKYFNDHPYHTVLEHAALATPASKGTITLDKKALLNNMPTPESFARSVGFANFNGLKKAVENPEHPEESRHYLLVGCSIIADMLTKAGLMDRLNANFTKFIMSAYLGINEKTDIYKQEDNRIIIEWRVPQELQVNTDKTHPATIELERLESALPPSMRMALPAPPEETVPTFVPTRPLVSHNQLQALY